MPLKQMSQAVSCFRSELVDCQEEALQICLFRTLLSAQNTAVSSTSRYAPARTMAISARDSPPCRSGHSGQNLIPKVTIDSRE